MNFFFGKSQLQRAIDRGLANGKLGEELRDLGETILKSRADGEAVCQGLQQLTKERSTKLGDGAYELARLFQEVKDRECGAFEVLQEQGIPHLLRLFDEMQAASEESDINTLLFILKILGLYGTTDGTLKIIEVARQPFVPDKYMWSAIFSNFTDGHPEAELFYRSICDPLPPDFMGVCLLDAANACLIADTQILHPFDSIEGKRRLQGWLKSSDAGEFSYAHSATVSLPFISNPERDVLLNLAMNHPDPGVQIEGAWAAAKLGLEEGLRRLANYCHDFNHAQKAKRYLSELNRKDIIPASANEPGFEALAEFAQWLAHPNELGRAPDHLEIVDHRMLVWPPGRESKPFWLIKYVLKDTTGLGEDDAECGLVGSMTFCFFSYKLAQRPPEDAYAVHCYWEMDHAKLIDEANVQDEPGDYQALLKEWKGGVMENPRMLFIAELSPELRPTQRLVGLASARLDGSDGWVVLDGDKSEWYPKTDMPPGAYESVILKIHVGRRLLGFTEKPDRKKYLTAPAMAKPAEKIVAAYEKLLSEAQKQDGRGKKEAFDSCRPIEKYFEEYARALVETGSGEKILTTIHLLAPFWEHNRGYGALGKAAFHSNQYSVAEDFFLKLRENYKDSHRSEEMGMLAEIWCNREKQNEAKELLLDCLRKLIVESKTATGSDKELFESWFQNQRGTLLKLFSSEGETALAANGVPNSTLS